MRYVLEHPLAALLERGRHAKRNSQCPCGARGQAPLSAMPLRALLPVLFLPPLAVHRPFWAAFLGIVLAAAYPCYLAAQQSSLLTRLRQKDVMSDLLGCATTPAELVDGLARYSLLQLWARPALGLALWAYALACWMGPAGALLAPLGMLAQSGLAVLLSYLAQCGAAWSRSEDDVLLRHLLVWVALAPGLLLTGQASSQAVEGHWVSALGDTAAAIALPALGLRWLALQGLTHFDRWSDLLKGFWEHLGGRVRNSWIDRSFGAWMTNPVVFREASREARRTPRGLPGLVWRHGQLALLWGGYLGLTHYGLACGWDRPQVGLWGFLIILLLLQTLRPAYVTVGALVDEREGHTLEGLMLTELSPVEWVDGWAAVASLPRTLENLVGAVVLLNLAGAIGLSPTRALLAGLMVTLLSGAAAYLGLAVSAAVTTRAQAYDRLGLQMLGLWLGGVAGLLACLVGPTLLGWLGLALGASWLVYLRRRALVSVSQPLASQAGSSGLSLEDQVEAG